MRDDVTGNITTDLVSSQILLLMLQGLLSLPSHADAAERVSRVAAGALSLPDTADLTGVIESMYGVATGVADEAQVPFAAALSFVYAAEAYDDFMSAAGVRARVTSHQMARYLECVTGYRMSSFMRLTFPEFFERNFLLPSVHSFADMELELAIEYKNARSAADKAMLDAMYALVRLTGLSNELRRRATSGADDDGMISDEADPYPLTARRAYRGDGKELKAEYNPMLDEE